MPNTGNEINETKLMDLLNKMVGEMGAAAAGALVLLGDRLGLYKELAESGPLNSTDLAERTGTHERYVREWLACSAASGYIEHDAANSLFSMTPEQAAIFSDEKSPVLLTGGYYALASIYSDEPAMEEAFRTGSGLAWGDHNDCLFCGTAKFFRPSYRAHLVDEWIPSLSGAREKLEAGARVADVGCGHGHSTVLLAEAFPKSKFIGFDIHEPSIAAASAHAKRHGLDNVTFEVASAQDFPGDGYDMVTFFDCLHDMGDPVGAAAQVCNALKDDGSMMVVEPIAADNVAGNMNPVGRLYYAFSTMVCTPSSLAQSVGLGLGAQAGEKRLAEVITEGGFGSVKRATETPFNMILEARKQ